MTSQLIRLQAIHYALMPDSAEAVDYLFQFENALTLQQVIVPVFLDSNFKSSNYSSNSRNSEMAPLYFDLPAGSSLVHFAVICNAAESLKLLLAKSVKFPDFNLGQQTPLMYASLLGRTELIHFLDK